MEKNQQFFLPQPVPYLFEDQGSKHNHPQKMSELIFMWVWKVFWKYGSYNFLFTETTIHLNFCKEWHPPQAAILPPWHLLLAQGSHCCQLNSHWWILLILLCLVLPHPASHPPHNLKMLRPFKSGCFTVPSFQKTNFLQCSYLTPPPERTLEKQQWHWRW